MTPKPAELTAGATYRITEHGVTEYELALAEPDSRGMIVLRIPETGDYMTAFAKHLVKVEPTPADRYALFMPGGKYHSTLDTATEALDFGDRHYGRGSRVARFTFAEWVES